MQLSYQTGFTEQRVKPLLGKTAYLVLIVLKSVHQLPSPVRQAGVAAVFSAMLPGDHGVARSRSNWLIMSHAFW